MLKENDATTKEKCKNGCTFGAMRLCSQLGITTYLDKKEKQIKK
jgi:hypothetical protein